MTAHRHGPTCPIDPAHGSVMPIADHPRWGWYCPHQAHDGVLHKSEPTRAFFTTEEVETGLRRAVNEKEMTG